MAKRVFEMLAAGLLKLNLPLPNIGRTPVENALDMDR